MQTGSLNQRVSIYRPTVTLDSMGGDVIGTPTLIGTFWAEAKYLNGYELQVAMQRWSEVKYRITMRRQYGITILATDYIAWNGQTLDIRAPEGPGTREPEWVIFAKDHLEADGSSSDIEIVWDDATGAWVSATGTWDNPIGLT